MSGKKKKEVEDVKETGVETPVAPEVEAPKEVSQETVAPVEAPVAQVTPKEKPKHWVGGHSMSDGPKG